MTPMKDILGLSVLVVLAVLLGSVESCSSSTECLSTQCCVIAAIGRRKLLQFGGCEAMPLLGQSCLQDYLVPGTRPVAPGSGCPCPAGTTCVPDGGHHIPLGPTGTCQRTGPPTGMCAVSPDCPYSQCCVVPLRGRRRLLQVTSNVCQAMPLVGQSCVVNPGLVPGTRPHTAGISCPCPYATTCVPDGGYMVPQGPTGVCRVNVGSGSTLHAGSVTGLVALILLIRVFAFPE